MLPLGNERSPRVTYICWPLILTRCLSLLLSDPNICQHLTDSACCNTLPLGKVILAQINIKVRFYHTILQSPQSYLTSTKFPFFKNVLISLQKPIYNTKNRVLHFHYTHYVIKYKSLDDTSPQQNHNKLNKALIHHSLGNNSDSGVKHLYNIIKL